MSSYRRGPSLGFLDFIPPGLRTILLVNIILYLLWPPDWGLNLFGIKHFVHAVLMLNFDLVTHHYFVWQVFTYMFLHGNFFPHLLFNMFLLFILGREMEQYFGTKNFVLYYLVCGLGAGICIYGYDWITYLITGQAASGTGTLGASGAIMGLLLAYGLFYPDRQMLLFFIIPIKMKYFLVGTAILSAFFMIFANLWPGVSHVGHLGGMLTGILYFRFMRRNGLFRAGNHTLDEFFSVIGGVFRGRRKSGYQGPIHPDDPGFSSPVRKGGVSFFRKKDDNLDENKMNDAEVEAKIDELLQVISRKGLKGLSIEEQLFLDRVSRLYRHKFPE